MPMYPNPNPSPVLPEISAPNGGRIAFRTAAVIATATTCTALRERGINHCVAPMSALDAAAVKELAKIGARTLYLIAERQPLEKVITWGGIEGALRAGVTLRIFETSTTSVQLPTILAGITADEVTTDIIASIVMPELLEWLCTKGWKERATGGVLVRAALVERDVAPLLRWVNSAAREKLAELLAESLELPLRGVRKTLKHAIAALEDADRPEHQHSPGAAPGSAK